VGVEALSLDFGVRCRATKSQPLSKGPVWCWSCLAGGILESHHCTVSSTVAARLPLQAGLAMCGRVEQSPATNNTQTKGNIVGDTRIIVCLGLQLPMPGGV
jgi:hypothetical protein